MALSGLDFRHGDQIAIRSAKGDFSFSDLHRLRPLLHLTLANHTSMPPSRILGCLNDDVDALFALLFLTELSDYMPINPALSDMETAELLRSSKAELCIVSSSLVATKSQALSASPIVVWEDLLDEAMKAMGTVSHRPSGPDWPMHGRLILHTSGSTGTPKRVPITLEAMNASARNIAVGHELREDDHALNVLPTFHIGALVDVMLAPFAVGGSVSITDQRSPEGLIKALIEQRPTWVQVVPTLLRRLVEDVAPDQLAEAGRSLRFIRSISAPVPVDLKAQVEKAFGCSVIEMYGMTETAGQISTRPRATHGAKAGGVGSAVGVNVAIMDRYGNIQKTGEPGEVCVQGPTVFAGYEGIPKEDVFFEDWFRTGDLGALDEDGVLFLRGRLKEMVNVGGEKVSPYEVESAVLELSDVVEAAAYALPHPTLGEQVGLTIAARGDVEEARVKSFLESRIAVFKCPNSITVVEQLPRLANAKVDRLLLKRTAEVEWRERQSSLRGSRNTLNDTAEARLVAKHWVRLLNCRPPSGDDDFFDMGGDSLSATQLLITLEKALNRQISPSQLFDAPTFSGLVSALSNDSGTTKERLSRPLRFIQEKTAGWPGQVLAPNGILRSLGTLKRGHPLFWSSQAHVEIDAILATIGKNRPLHVTGSLRRFPRRTEQDFRVLGEHLADEISNIQPKGPIVLGGFCGGAWVMHHAAEILRARGRNIRAFISFDYWPAREIQYPMVHCMSHCEINSARVHFAQHHLTENLLHRGGTMTLEVDSKHRFDAEDIAPHLSVLNGIIEGTDHVPSAEPIDTGIWSLKRRLDPPKARVKLIKSPKIYTPSQNAQIEVEVTNMSDVDWAATEISGLSIQVDLINLDGHVRKAKLAYGRLSEVVPAGGRVRFSFDVMFPEKRIPMWLSCSLVSQGLKHFSTRASGRRRSMIFPNLVKASRLIASKSP
ncbi:AMP-binding protein [Octadecabacter ascidiaceicola]|uniref:Putative sulfoacetate--CoA ligase n=1 Tax=Octadecabacter ascidiaceicola TaxID=1655543 RepID=A0A238KI74_9RHOB|nr:AMP-binding protein [Octadecabacter ascidiaceicola]SMX42408.1 putative sulfoacetate--CoA ligase [Octadecabacter ascidiaceicola]